MKAVDRAAMCMIQNGCRCEGSEMRCAMGQSVMNSASLVVNVSITVCDVKVVKGLSCPTGILECGPVSVRHGFLFPLCCFALTRRRDLSDRPRVANQHMKTRYTILSTANFIRLFIIISCR